MKYKHLYISILLIILLIKVSDAQNIFTSGFFNYEVVTNLNTLEEGTNLSFKDNQYRYSYIECIFDNNFTLKKRTTTQPTNTKLSFSFTPQFSIINEDSNFVYTQRKIDCDNENIFIKQSIQNLKIRFTGRTETILFYNCEEVIVEINNQFDTAFITKELPINISPFLYYRIKEGAILKYKQKSIEHTLLNVALQIKTSDVIQNGLKMLAEKTILNATPNNYEPSFELTKLKKNLQLKKINQNSFREVFLFPTPILKSKGVDDEAKSNLEINDALEIATEIVSNYKNTRVLIFIEDDAALLKHCNADLQNTKQKNMEVISNAGKIMQALNIRFTPTVAVIDTKGKVVELEYFFFNKDDIKNRLFDALLE